MGVKGTAFLLALLLAAPGCKEGSPPQNNKESKPQDVTPVEKAVEKTPAASAEEQAGPVSVESATALVHEWKRAQNSGVFEDYEKLYATRMSGLKRVGTRETSFDRNGWLADRKQMFARPFTVEVSGLKVSLAGGVAVVRFEQTWSNPRFRDVGPKQLVIVAEDGQPRISREEMLESNQAGEKVGGVLPPGAVGLVRGAGVELRYLLARKPELNWMSSSPEMTPGGAVVREVAAQLVPEKERALVGKRFELFDESGRKCEAVAAKLEVLIDVEPHFGVVAQWNGAEGTPPVPPARRALELWEMSSRRGQFLTLRLELSPEQAKSAACAKPVWGRVVRADATEWKIADAVGEEKKRLAAVALRQADYRALFQGSGETPSEKNVHIVRTFSHSDGRKYAIANLWAPGSLCGQPMPMPYWVVLRVRGTSAHIVSDGEVGSRSGPPLGAVSVPGLSEPVFVERSFIYRYAESDGNFRTFLNQETESLDCGC